MVEKHESIARFPDGVWTAKLPNGNTYKVYIEKGEFVRVGVCNNTTTFDPFDRTIWTNDKPKRSVTADCAMRQLISDFQDRAAAFRKATEGKERGPVSRALNDFTPGVEFNGCSMSSMRDEFATGLHLRHVTIDRMQRAIAAAV